MGGGKNRGMSNGKPLQGNIGNSLKKKEGLSNSLIPSYSSESEDEEEATSESEGGDTRTLDQSINPGAVNVGVLHSLVKYMVRPVELETPNGIYYKHQTLCYSMAGLPINILTISAIS